MSEDRLAASVRELGDYKDKIESMSQDFARSKQELTCAHDQLHRDRIQFQEETLKQSEENDNLKRQIEAQVEVLTCLDASFSVASRCLILAPLLCDSGFVLRLLSRCRGPTPSFGRESDRKADNHRVTGDREN